MAINLSYTLGIHKEETLPMFDPSEQTARWVALLSHLHVLVSGVKTYIFHADEIYGDLCMSWIASWP
jgi:hypothetical protein